MMKLDSEYKSHFKTLPVHRPRTVKAKVVSHPTGSAPEALESSRRAGLLSNQFSNVSEPALQRKRIVPYRYNHNIFATKTVKEMGDREWLDAVGSDEDTNRSHNFTVKDKQKEVAGKKENTEYRSHFTKEPVEKDSPLIRADKTRLKKTSKLEAKDRNPATKTTTEHSPDRLPPAGRPTYVSDSHDKRLLRPSDGSCYLTFPDDQPTRQAETEYSERYYNAIPRNEGTSVYKNKETSNIDEATYRKVLSHRNDAYGLTVSPSKFSPKRSPESEKDSVVDKHRPRQSQMRNPERNSLKSQDSASSIHSERSRHKNKMKEDLTEERLVFERNKSLRKDSGQRRSLESESMSSLSSAIRFERKNRGKNPQAKDEHRTGNGENIKTFRGATHGRSRREAWEDNPTPSITESNTDTARSTCGSSGTREDFLKHARPRGDLERDRTRGNATKRKETRGGGVKYKGKSKDVRGDRESRQNKKERDRTPREAVDRGRSPTPEMRNVGQSRRHHLDVTTGINNPLASYVDPFTTRVLGKSSETQHKPRVVYDPSRYSDAGDSYSSSHSMMSWTDRGSVDSRAVTASSRSSKRSI